jgi:uncharacterized protein
MRLSGYLQKMAVVRRITPVHASGDRLELDLELLSGLSGFQRMLGDDAPFTGPDGPMVEGETPTYRMH